MVESASRKMISLEMCAQEADTVDNQATIKKNKKRKKGEKMIICNQENISPEYFYSPLKFFKQMPFFINKWKFCTYILPQEFLSLFEIISAILCAQ